MKFLVLLLAIPFVAIEAYSRGFDVGQQRCLLPHVEDFRGD